MHYSHHRNSTKPVHWESHIVQPPLGDGSFMVPMNDPLDSIHAERQPERSVDRHREMVMLDRLFWTSVGLLMVGGLALKIWILF